MNGLDWVTHGFRQLRGRHAGWIAAAGGLVDDSIPVVILFPEVDFGGSNDCRHY
jgi:6-phosphofructokinase